MEIPAWAGRVAEGSVWFSEEAGEGMAVEQSSRRPGGAAGKLRAVVDGGLAQRGKTPQGYVGSAASPKLLRYSNSDYRPARERGITARITPP